MTGCVIPEAFHANESEDTWLSIVMSTRNLIVLMKDEEQVLCAPKRNVVFISYHFPAPLCEELAVRQCKLKLQLFKQESKKVIAYELLSATFSTNLAEDIGRVPLQSSRNKSGSVIADQLFVHCSDSLCCETSRQEIINRTRFDETKSLANTRRERRRSFPTRRETENYDDILRGFDSEVGIADPFTKIMDPAKLHGSSLGSQQVEC